jgi:hypothetical protein
MAFTALSGPGHAHGKAAGASESCPPHAAI